MPSIKDVAQQAGVSPTTVSFVLNNKGNISESTRDHVLQVVENMGYTRSVHARNLRDQQSRVIGYTWERRLRRFNYVMDHFMHELMRLTELNDRHLLLFLAESNDDIAVYRDLYDSNQVDGFVLSYTNHEDPRFRYLHETGIPFVSFGRSNSPLDDVTHWVDVDGQVGLYAATAHLIAQGHERIGMISWPQASASGDLRYAGYVDAMNDHGLPRHPGWLVRTDNQVQMGYRAAQEILDCHPQPTAIATVSDTLASGAMRYITEAGLRIALTGFDNTPIADFMHPQLTSLHQPVDEVAAILMDMLLAQLNGREVQQKQHVLEPQLIIRSSSTLEY